jgi:cytochrome c551/c552
MKLIFKFVLIFIIVTISVSVYLLINNKKSKAIKAAPVYESCCGTKSATQNNGDAQKGKQIFNANCAACHKLDAVATAPALRNIVEKYRKQNLDLHDYLRGKRKKLLLKGINKMGLCPVFPNLTKEDVASLEYYLEPRY